MYDLGIPNRLPLPSATQKISALKNSTASLFAPDDTIWTAYNRLLIEEWEVRSNYESYYDACAPPTCTYTITRRADYLYVASTLVGIFGGLSVTFRLLVPLIVRLAYGIRIQWRERHRQTRSPAIGKFFHE